MYPFVQWATSYGKRALRLFLVATAVLYPSESQVALGQVPERLVITAAECACQIPIIGKFKSVPIQRLSCILSSSDARITPKVRFYANDTNGNMLFQRVIIIPRRNTDVTFDVPFKKWRWGSNLIGDWEEVTSLALSLEGDGHLLVRQLSIDDAPELELGDQPEYRAAFAFDGVYRQFREKNIFIATDALEMSENIIHTIIEKSAPAKDWLQAALPRAFSPCGGDVPTQLFIFRVQEHYPRFFERLGESLGLSIAPPQAGGYTFQDVAASAWKEDVPERPVFFHELVHAIVARTIRLDPGKAEHKWLQEGIASYLQLCFYPSSIARNDMVRNFSQPVTGSTLFKPIRALLSETVTTRQYAQLATIIGFMIDVHPAWLDAFACAADRGEKIDETANKIGMDFDSLEAEWLTWGRRRFSPGTENESLPHFPIPKNWNN